MPLTVNTNVASLAAQRSMLTTNSALETSFERLASGKRINSASDDAAGMAVANSFTSCSIQTKRVFFDFVKAEEFL